MEPKYLKNGVFSEKIEKYTIENSNFQSERDYEQPAGKPTILMVG